MESQYFNRRKLLSLLGVVVLSIGLGLALVSCYPGDDITTSQTDIVATVVDQTADFSTKLTYARPPSVVEITDPTQPPPGGSNPPTVGDTNPAAETQILSSIDQNMQSLGFSLVLEVKGQPAVADVHVVPFAAETTWTGTTCYPYYWDYWYGGVGWCYPATYTFTTGSILIAMLDPSKPANSPPIWVAGINGLLDGSTGTQLLTRINNTIDQAFKQSSYLGAGK